MIYQSSTTRVHYEHATNRSVTPQASTPRTMEGSHEHDSSEHAASLYQDHVSISSIQGLVWPYWRDMTPHGPLMSRGGTTRDLTLAVGCEVCA